MSAAIILATTNASICVDLGNPRFLLKLLIDYPKEEDLIRDIVEDIRLTLEPVR